MSNIERKLRGMATGPKVRRVLSTFASVNEQPIVLLGNQKSGTTAIAALLARHTGVSATLDIPGIYEPVQTMLHDGRMTFDEFVQRHTYDFSHTIVKEPCLTFLYPEMRERFPGARYVMIVRDPRTNIRSLLNRRHIPGNLEDFDVSSRKNISPEWQRILDNRWLGAKSHNYIEGLAERWNIGIDAYLQNRESMMLVRYEDFTRNKVEYIAELARRLNLPSLHDISSKTEKQFQPAGDRKIGALEFFGSVNLERIERLCGERMEEVGYTTTSPTRAAATA